jgi:hypothetical protein
MTTFLTTFLTLLTLGALVALTGYLLAMLAALTFDAAVGRLALPGPARVTTRQIPRRTVQPRRASPNWRHLQAGGHPWSRVA